MQTIHPVGFSTAAIPLLLFPAHGLAVQIDPAGNDTCAGGDSRVVGRNMFLDGTLFEDSLHIDRNERVADLTVGVALRFSSVTLTFGQVSRTPEVAGETRFHNFGVAELSIELEF